MRVLFISANREDINMPTLPMGLGCVAAATQKANHDVLFVDRSGKPLTNSPPRSSVFL
jgi:hypothetical protein